ncbi:MAG: pirin family protein [Gammaproteobacteria bacterium]|nr:pirin family protein [Gammaproteobacteria bacterium]
MLQLRPSQQRGIGEHGGWLRSRHSFSFADYVDPQHMGFSALRVINDDEVAPGAGFPQHAHRDMEIISVVLQGSLEHRDSMGHVSRLHAGEVQRMSAGTGITHSEYNPSPDEPLRFLQIWIVPDRPGITPSYEQRSLPDTISEPLTLLASADGQAGAMRLQQDARLYFGRLAGGASVQRRLDPARKYYLYVIQAGLQANRQVLNTGDAVSIVEESKLNLVNELPTDSNTQTEFLFFDLP